VDQTVHEFRVALLTVAFATAAATALMSGFSHFFFPSLARDTMFRARSLRMWAIARP
jgi:hypothetical protein